MLVQMQQRLTAAHTLEKAVWVVLDDVIALHGAEFGSLQFFAGDKLLLVAQRGFGPAFVEHFRRVSKEDGCVCGRALRLRSTVVVPDIEKDPDLLPLVAMGRESGFRAVQSTPLMKGDIFVGVVSTHFANVHEPTPIEMQTLADYSIIAAARLHRLLDDLPLPDIAEKLSRKLCRRSATRTRAGQLKGLTNP